MVDTSISAIKIGHLGDFLRMRRVSYPLSAYPEYAYMGVSENVVYPIVPNGFADHDPYEKWLAIIGKINPTFSDKPIYQEIILGKL